MKLIYCIFLANMLNSCNVNGAFLKSSFPESGKSVDRSMHPNQATGLTVAETDGPENFTMSTEFYINKGKQFVAGQLKAAENNVIAKNIVLFLGDGMSVTTLAAARMYMGDEESSLSFEKFPFLGMVKTYCVDKQVPDSACTATGLYSQHSLLIFQL